MGYPFGIDVSFYQGHIDPYFGFNWNQAQESGLHRIAYYVMDFGISGKLQAELLFDRARNYQYEPEHDKLCLDVELNRNWSRGLITNVTLEAINRLKTLTGVYPLIYSRASWLNSYLNVSLLPRLDYWLAGYRKRLPEPLLPVRNN